MSEVIYLLDPGHGGMDPGACYNGRKEKDDVLALTLKVKPHLERSGAKVFLTRDTDVTLTLTSRTAKEKAVNASYFIAIHRNAITPEKAKGVETFSLTTTSAGRKLAENIHNEIVSMGVTNNRGLKTANYYVLRCTNCPATLVEAGFIDNSEDNAWFDAHIDELAIAIAKGALKTAGLEYVPEQAPVVIPEPTPAPAPEPVYVAPPQPVEAPKPTSDPHIADVQNKMNVLGFTGANGHALVVDGINGNNTETAVKKFQKVAGLAQDGDAGPKTMAAINAILAKPTLKEGANGVAVRYLQYKVGAGIDGDFGPGTKRAVIAFQRNKGLTGDGIVGARSWSRII